MRTAQSPIPLVSSHPSWSSLGAAWFHVALLSSSCGTLSASSNECGAVLPRTPWIRSGSPLRPITVDLGIDRLRARRHERQIADFPAQYCRLAGFNLIVGTGHDPRVWAHYSRLCSLPPPLNGLHYCDEVELLFSSSCRDLCVYHVWLTKPTAQTVVKFLAPYQAKCRQCSSYQNLRGEEKPIEREGERGESRCFLGRNVHHHGTCILPSSDLTKIHPDFHRDTALECILIALTELEVPILTRQPFVSFNSWTSLVRSLNVKVDAVAQLGVSIPPSTPAARICHFNPSKITALAI